MNLVVEKTGDGSVNIYDISYEKVPQCSWINKRVIKEEFKYSWSL